MDKAAAIITRMGSMSNRAHESIAHYLEEQLVEMTRNKNGYFVDLLKLNGAQLESLERKVCEVEAGEGDSPEDGDVPAESMLECPDEGGQEGEPSAPAAPTETFAAVSTKTVMDKINDILKKHIPPGPFEPRKKQVQSYKRTLVVTHRRTEGYEPRFNELSEDVLVC